MKNTVAGISKYVQAEFKVFSRHMLTNKKHKDVPSIRETYRSTSTSETY
jgi:hypothetical protein